MKNYKVEFTVNGKMNRHGLYVTACCIDSASSSARNILHNVLDNVVSNYEIISISLVHKRP